MATDLVIAGAGADGHGVLTGWHGSGGLPYARLVEIARRAGIANEYMPQPKNAATQLARAVKASAGGRLNVEPGAVDDDEERKPEARWWLVEPATRNARPGDVAGSIALVVSLYRTGEGVVELVFDTQNEAALASTIRHEFDERVGAEQLIASDITKWLNDVHRLALNAVRYGVGWYVPRAKRQIAEAIVESFVEVGWGESWMNPPCPVATSSQMATGIAKGLAAEVAEVMLDLKNTRDKLRAAKNDQKADIGPRAAETFMIRFSRCGARMVSHAAVLGKDLLAECQDVVHDAMIELDAVLEGGITADWNGTWSTIEHAGRRLAS